MTPLPRRLGVRPGRGTAEGIDREQMRQAPPFTCRRCGAPVYLETLSKGRKRYVDADTLQPHAWRCVTKATSNMSEAEKGR